MIPPDRWERAKDLFDETLRLPVVRRAEFLADACGSDDTLRREVESLVASHEEAGDFLNAHETGPLDDGQGGVWTGRRVGPYRMLGLIGRGGMGDVYRAVRDDDHFKKVVAVKLVRPEVASDVVQDRLRVERQILACLEHPGIARLIDGGATDDGRPFLVMEYVEGTRIDTFAEERGLDTRARVELFRSVCAAVQHAHQNLVVHRDLKPANILVTEEGAPKLLDFGVAKLLDPGGSGESTATAFPAMTPAYASPEQVRGEPITTATDVYSLGTVLYELLTGVRPHRLAGATPLQQAICEQIPERPSTAQRTSRTAGEAGRGTKAPRSGRAVGADLDAIVMKALRKEPSRRYPTVEAFSEDLHRYLEGLPVTAAKGTFTYRAGKFARRNRLSVALALVAISLAAAFAINVAVQARRVAREKDRAERVTAFLVELFRVADPGESRGNTVTAREMLDKGTARLETELKDEPEVRAALLDTIGQVHFGLGLYDRAVTLAREGLETRRQVLGSRHPAVAESLDNLGAAQYQKGDYTAAEASYREALALKSEIFGPERPQAATSLHGVALVLHARADHAGAEQLYRQALGLQRTFHGNEHADVARSLHDLARLLRARGDLPGSEALHREALAMRRRLLGNDHPSVTASLNNLALVLYQQGKPEALPMFRETLAANRQLMGDAHPRVAGSIANLAGALGDFEANYVEAETLSREVLERMRGSFGNEHPEVARALHNHASILEAMGDAASADIFFRQALSSRRKLLGSEHPSVALSLNSLAIARQQLGDDAGAEALHREALAMNLKLLGGAHPQVAFNLTGLAKALYGQQRTSEAEAHYRQALEIFRTAAQPGDLNAATAMTGLADVLAEAGDWNEAATLARQALATRRQAQVPDHPAVLEAESVLGACLAAGQRLVEAEPLLRDSSARLKVRGRSRDAREAARRLSEAMK